MTFLVRKVNKAKWHLEGFSDGDPVNADAITNCLKTTGNTLSFWEVEDEGAIEQAVLAIAASNTNLDTFDVVVIESSFFEEAGFSVERSSGFTHCEDLKETHRDLVGLNISHLARLSNKIACVVSRNDSKRYTLATLKKILLGAVSQGRINLDTLPEGIRRKLPGGSA